MDILATLEGYVGRGRIKLAEPLARYTTLRIGGPAEYFFTAQTTFDLQQAFKAAQAGHMPITVLGGGSNTLISDAGIKGLVVRNQSRAIKVIKKFGRVVNGEMVVDRALVEADTGTMINQLVRFSCDEGLAGLERHLGLPGTVGGALFMNSKWTKPIAYVGEVLYQAKILAESGEIKLVDKQYFNFGYDQSILQKTREVVVSAIFLLKKEDPKILWQRAQTSMDYRKTTQPMGVSTAGCTFRNISQAEAFRLATPDHTTSAGYLVDQVGLKGYQVGQAKFSDKHANFILNLGSASADDVKNLIDEAKKRVEEKYNVVIEPEIVLLGTFN